MAEQPKLTAEQKAVVYEYFREMVYNDRRLPFKELHKRVYDIAHEEDIPAEALLSARVYGKYLSALPGSLFPREQMRHIKTHHEAAAQNFIYRMLQSSPKVIDSIDRCVESVRWLDVFVTQLVNLHAKPEASKSEFVQAKQKAVASAAVLGIDGQGASALVTLLEEHLRHALKHMPSPEEAVRIRANHTGVAKTHKEPVLRGAPRPISLESVQSRRALYMKSVLDYKPVKEVVDHFAQGKGFSRAERLASISPELEPLLYKTADGGNKAQHGLKEQHLADLDIMNTNDVDLLAGREAVTATLAVFRQVFDRALEVRAMNSQQCKDKGFIRDRIFTSEEHHALVKALQKAGAVSGPVEALEYVRKAETKAQSLLGVSQRAGHIGR